jgi:hypothetical protein
VIDKTNITFSANRTVITGCTPISGNQYQINATRPSDNNDGQMYYYVRNIYGDAVCNINTGVVTINQPGKFLLCCFTNSNGIVCGQGDVFN